MPSIIWEDSIRKNFEHHVFKFLGCTTHFAVNLITPEKKAITICSNSEYLKSYNKFGMSKFEAALSPWELRDYPVIPWRMKVNSSDILRVNKLVSFKEIFYGLYSGMTFVSKVDDCYFSVGIATNKSDSSSAIRFLENSEEILNLGAYFYGIYRERLEELNEERFPEINEIILNDRHYLYIDLLKKEWSEFKTFTAIPENILKLKK